MAVNNTTLFTSYRGSRQRLISWNSIIFTINLKVLGRNDEIQGQVTQWTRWVKVGCILSLNDQNWTASHKLVA